MSSTMDNPKQHACGQRKNIYSYPSSPEHSMLDLGAGLERYIRMKCCICTLNQGLTRIDGKIESRG
jgi:hypothetical protein